MGSSTKGLNAGGGGPEWQVQLTVGSECMLDVTGRHFLVTILEIKDDTLHVSFPGKDYPIQGMRGALEFHDKEGFSYYLVQVTEGPTHKGSGIWLRRTESLKRSKHRDACRVTTDLMAQVKDEAHVRRFNADLLNIGAGGALIQTEAPFDFSTTAELAVSLPGEPSHTIRCHVVDMLPPSDKVHPNAKRFCLRFVEVEPDAEKSISRYVWQRLSQMYPAD